MWYFSWILSLGLACAFAILNAMWFEVMDDAWDLREMTSRPAKDSRNSASVHMFSGSGGPPMP